MNDYLRLPEAPQLSWRYPDCAACCVEVTNDGDGWLCPSCGTAWNADASDGDKGMMFEEWAGEPAGGPDTSLDNAWRARP